MNEMAALCTKVGADISLVRQGMAWDDRIGTKFLFPGVGYGGACFPKDVQAILSTAKGHGIPLKVLYAVEEVNRQQKRVMALRLLEHFGGTVKGLVVALWGLAFKPDTDDVREAPAKVIADILLEAGATLRLHDPQARETFAQILPPSPQAIYCDNNYDAVSGADALILCTEWRMYRSPDFRRIKGLMKQPVLFDGRNMWDPQDMRELGFSYSSIGRP
jgi:UDPglucose 6-dehydrogenase